MERDFLGIGGQQSSGSPMKKENRGGRMDSAISIGSPFSNKASPLQQFMSFASVDAPEKSLGVERLQLYRASTRPLNEARFATVKPHSSVPIAMTSPFLKSHGSSPNPTATSVKQQPLGSRNVLMKPLRKKAQLTIFYAGSVIVYDDVSCDMAKAIMLMASKECETAVHQRPVPSFSKGMVSDGLRLTTQTLSNTTDHAVHQCSDLSSTESNDKASAKTTLAQISASQNESSRAVMPNAVPQARKASLARFLEKRKERVSNMMPYSCEKKGTDSSNAADDGSRSSKCSSSDASMPRNQGGSWCVGQIKSCSGDGYYPGIKLDM